MLGSHDFYKAKGVSAGGVSIRKPSFYWLGKAQKELRFDPHATPDQIESAVRRKKGEIDWGLSLLCACNNLVESNDLAQVDYCLSKGADPNWGPAGEWDNSLEGYPLRIACAQGHLPLLKRLLASGGKVNMDHIHAAIRCIPCKEGRHRSLAETWWTTSSCEAIQVLDLLTSLLPADASHKDWGLSVAEQAKESNPQAADFLELRFRGYL